MANSNYQEPIEQKDLDMAKKIKEVKIDSEETVFSGDEKKEVMPMPDISGESQAESNLESPKEKVPEKIEAARKTIGAQQAQPAANIATDAQGVSQIQEFEKKVEKLVEIAVQKGPEHAIQVARHLEKGKDPGTADNYTLDEIHDRLMEEELRKQLIAKGLLKEL